MKTSHSPQRLRVNLNSTARRDQEYVAGEGMIALHGLENVCRLACRDEDQAYRIYRKYHARPTQLLEQFAEGTLNAEDNEYQEKLRIMFAGRDSFHLYFSTWRPKDPTHYIAFARNEQNLFVPSTRRIRKAPERLGDGAFFDFGRGLPHPGEAVFQQPSLLRLYKGGKASQSLIREMDALWEVKRQIAHAYLTLDLHGSAHRDQIKLYSDPGCLTLERVGDADLFVNPGEWRMVSVRDYAPTPTGKPRVIVRSNVSSEGIYVQQIGRCIVSDVKYAPPYLDQMEDQGEEGWLTTWLLKHRLVPFVGIIKTNGVSIVGLCYDPEERECYIGEFAADRTLRSCEGLPLFGIVDPDAKKKTWKPNRAMALILRDLIYDPSPDEPAVADRWMALRAIFGMCGAKSWLGIPDYFADLGVPLPDDAGEQIAHIKAILEKYHKSR